jgi:hypothetical protein
MILNDRQLASVFGGAGFSPWGAVKGAVGASQGSPGSGTPSSFMDMADQPGKTLDAVRGFGILPKGGNPGDTYNPATQNAGGGITGGSFSPSGMSDVSPPISQ